MSRQCRAHQGQPWMAGLRQPWRIPVSSSAGPPPCGCGTRN